MSRSTAKTEGALAYSERRKSAAALADQAAAGSAATPIPDVRELMQQQRYAEAYRRQLSTPVRDSWSALDGDLLALLTGAAAPLHCLSTDAADAVAASACRLLQDYRAGTMPDDKRLGALAQDIKLHAPAHRYWLAALQDLLQRQPLPQPPPAKP
jgi:hypothetical protein